MKQRDLLIQDADCPGKWVLLGALSRSEAGELFALGGYPEQRSVREFPQRIQVVQAPEAVQSVEITQQLQEIPEDTVQQLKQSLSYRYPHLAATAAPSKQTATQRKGRVKDQEAAENTAEPRAVFRQWRLPSFVDGKAQAVDYGNAVHRTMQHIAYASCTSVQGVTGELQRLVAEGLLDAQQAAMVRPEQILGFFQTEIGNRILRAKQVLREFKFSILDDGVSFDSRLEGEKILLQGVVDLAVIESDGILLVDFKTDRVTEQTVEETANRYAPQVEAYAQALGRIYNLPVKEKMLYFFRLNRFVDL